MHSPEFAFERVESNVRENADDLGVAYPIALDNDFGTWSAWHNRYWPAKYLIDRHGHVRYYHFGEGEYAETEDAIRTLLGDDLPPASGAKEAESDGLLITPETYLGFERLARYGGEAVVPGVERDYDAARGSCTRASSRSAGAGESRTSGPSRAERRGSASPTAPATSSSSSRGRATVEVLVDGKPERRVRVRGDRLYTLVDRDRGGDHLLELRVAPGLAAYAFTFG